MKSKPFCFIGCKSELTVLLHNASYAGQNSVLLVGMKGETAATAHKIDLLLKESWESFGNDVNLFLLEFRKFRENSAEAIISCPGKNRDFDIHFDLPIQQKHLLELLQALNIDEIEYLDRSRSERQVAAITKDLNCSRHRYKTAVLSSPAIINNESAAGVPAGRDNLETKYWYASENVKERSKVELPLVSICLPVRNAEHSIEETLASILQQDLEEIEVLVPDNCSDDRTFDLLLSFAQKDKRVLPWRHEQVLGKFESYNECLLRANGKYIKPLTQSDILSKSCLSRMVSCMQNDPDLVLTTIKEPQRIEANDITQLPQDFSKQTPVQWLKEGGIFALREQLGTASQVMFCADAIGKGFDKSFIHFAEVNYWLRILQKGDFAVILESGSSNVRSTEWSADNKHFIEMACELLDLQKQWDEHFTRFELDGNTMVDQALLYLASKFVANEDKNGRNGVTRLDDRTVDIGTLQTLTMSILGTLGRCRLSPADQEKTQRHILVLEKQLRSLLETFSWKVTKPMRDFRALLKTANELPEKIALEQDLNQEEYAWYLKDIIRRVKTSRSWQLTAPIRSFDGTRKQILKSRRQKHV